jgi:predicted ester cyclase
MDNKLLARRFLEEVVNTGAIELLDQFLAPEFVVRYTGIQGLEAARQHIQTFHHCYPDLHVTVEGQVAENDIVVTWFTMRGTHRGEWGGIKPTNKAVTLRCINIQRVRAGLIVEQWGGANTFEVLFEIGAIQLANQG